MTERIDLLLAGDRNVAMPMAVTLASAAATLRPGETLRAFLFVEGYDAALRERVAALRAEPRPELVWVEVDDPRIPEPPPGHLFPKPTYFRTLLGDLLPSDVRRVLYLDTDMVLVGRVADLARADLGGAVLGAVRDANLAWMSMSPGCARWRELGLPPDAPYFNAGMLLVDVDRWRRDGIGEAVLRDVRSRIAELKYADQDALNIVLHGRWKDLGAAWNQTASVHLPHGLVHARLAPHEVDALRTRPNLVHYTGALPKPWTDPAAHPLAGLWYEALERTAWAGWRPPPKARPTLLRRLRRAAEAFRRG